MVNKLVIVRVNQIYSTNRTFVKIKLGHYEAKHLILTSRLI